MMRRVLSLLDGVDLRISTQTIDEQLGMAERGELDLAAMVLDDEATLLANAVRSATSIFSSCPTSNPLHAICASRALA